MQGMRKTREGLAQGIGGSMALWAEARRRLRGDLAVARRRRGGRPPSKFEAKHRVEAAHGTAAHRTLATVGLAGHPSAVGSGGLYSAAPQRKLLTPSGEGRESTTVPQFLPVH